MKLISDSKLLENIEVHNKLYFAKGNKEFFGDIEYYGLYGSNQEKYLVTKTKKWSSGIYYIIKPVDDDYKIGHSIAELHKAEQVHTFIRTN
jgi:hypothetical protein